MRFFNRDKKPKIAFEEQKNGVRKYFIKTWQCYESGCAYMQETEKTNSLEKAKKMLKEITDKEIINQGYIDFLDIK